MGENFEYITRGGFIMVPLLLLSVYTAGVVVLKLMQFRQLHALQLDYTNEFINLVKTGEFKKAEDLLASKKGPVAKVLTATYLLIKDENIPRDRMEAEVLRVGGSEIRTLESHMRGLEMTANIGPLLGLLGTVIGMIKAFAKLADAGARVDPSILATGIWEALITTVTGLAVAIPAVVAFYIIDSYIEKVRSGMKDSVTRLLVLEKKLRAAHKPALPQVKASKIKAVKAAKTA